MRFSISSQPLLIGEMLQSLNHLCLPLLHSSQYVLVFIVLEKIELDTAVQSPVLSRGEGSYSTTWWKWSAYCCQGYFLCRHSADLRSTLYPLCPQGPFVPQYFPGGQLTACTGVCSCFSLCTRLHISLCWTSQVCCQPTFQPGQGPFGSQHYPSEHQPLFLVLSHQQTWWGYTLSSYPVAYVFILHGPFMSNSVYIILLLWKICELFEYSSNNTVLLIQQCF